MTPTTATPFLPRWILLSLAVLLLVFAAVFLPGVLSADWSPFSAQSEDGSEVPPKPSGLSVATEQGSLDVSADWDDVEGADDYLVRWRPNGERLNEGVRAQSSSAAITVAAYGEWVVRVQACNDAGCGKPAAQRFSVEPAPEPTPTPAPNTPNKPPVFHRNNIRFHTVLENYGPLINAGTYVVRDPENDQITRSLAGADAASFSASQFLSGNELRIFLDLNATPDYESPADANGDGVYEVTIRATDAGGSGETTELDVTVTVLDVDEAPVITGPAAVSFAEHSGSGVGQYSAADPEGETATLTLGGTDAASFTFADGTLTFNAAPDYETQDSYSVSLTASDGTNTSTLSVTITITDVDETTVNFGPVVDDQAERYQGFTGTDNAPRGTLVSKVYDGIFSDPNGDELTYTVSVPADRSALVDTVYVLEDIQRVFIRLDAEDDWGAVTPALPKPLVTTVTLTATDPGGLSASVTGEFQTNWEAAPAPALLSVCDRTSQVRDVLVKLLDKACENIGAKDLARVVKLDLSNKGLRSLRTEDFSGMSSLREVDASSNAFTSWADACAADYGDEIQNINLTNNKLGGTGATIPAGCFTPAKFPELRSLHLAATRINSLSNNAFVGLTKLEILDLSQNQITIVAASTFEDLSNLWYLDLGRNALTKEGLQVLRSGSVVNDAIFDNLSSLEWLALNNQFEQDSANNFEPKTTAQLTELDAAVFTGLSSLKELDLANNGLTSSGTTALPNDVFNPLSSLEGLALFGNPGAPWTATQLTALGVRTEANVIQVVTPPTGFTVEPMAGGVKLSWDDPSDTNMSHQYRYLNRVTLVWSAWTAISSPTTSGTKLEHTVSLSSRTGYAFQLRSVKSGAHSYHADGDCTAIFGTAGNDTLTAEGADCVVGLGGHDTLISGYGPDELDGGAGTDTVSYRDSPGSVRVSLSITTQQDENEPLSAARGDVLSNIEDITGSAHDDTLTGDASNNTLTGGNGDDTLKGNAGADALNGGDGDDVIEGGVGGDTLNGGVGTDTLSYSGSGSFVTVNLATPAASGGHATGDTISNFENILGSAHGDTLTGDANANVIEGGAGGDTLNGAGGSDTVSYAGSSAGVTVTINGTTSGGDAAGDTISNFENIIGSANVDTLTGNANANVIEGGAGGDTLNGAGGSDTVSYAGSSAGVTVTINGTTSGGDAAGDSLSNFENILGSAHGDTLTGDANANVIEGGAGGDTLDCAGDTDTVSYAGAGAAVTVNLNDGTRNSGDAAGDSISNCEIITGSDHADTLTGDANANVINGGLGADTMTGGAGADTLNGGAGNDVIEGGAGADTMTAGAGTDTLSYAGSRSVWVDLGATTPVFKLGDAAGDSASGFENLIGSTHSDILIGDANDNVIIGNGRADELDGGAGTDTVSYALSDDSVVFNFAGGNFTNKDSDNPGDRVGGGGHAEGNVIATTTNDGGDIIPTFENVIGSVYPDWFIIHAAGNKIDGGHSIDDGKSTIYFPKADDYRDARNSIGMHVAHEFYHGLGDVVDYRKSSAAVTVNLTTGTNTGGSAQGDTLTGIESIVGSHHADTLTGDENNNTFFGLAGGDTFDGKGGTDVVDYSWGNPFTMKPPFNTNNTLLTLDLKTPTNNTWHAAGDTFSNIEWFIGSIWNDKITGGDGNDRLSGGAGEDTIRGGAGDDTLYGGDLVLRRTRFGEFYDELRGGAGNDHLIVGGDAAWGEAGNDKFLIMTGSNSSDGGAGTDEYYLHRDYFPAPAKDAGPARIWNYADNENIWICLGSGQGDGMNDADGEVSWTTTVEELEGDNTIDDLVVTVSLQDGTTAVDQGTFIVVDFTDTSKVDIAWSDPNAAVGTGCNFVDVDSVPGRTRMIRSEISKLIQN